MKDIFGRFLVLSALGTSLAHGGLIAHYTFDETSGTTAAGSGPAAIDGIVGANVTMGDPGKFGTAFTFKNDTTNAGVVRMGNAASLFSAITASQKLTISVWMKWTAPGTRDCAVFLGNSASTRTFIDVGTASGTNGVYGRVRNNVDSGFPLLDPSTTASGPLNNGEWHHVAYTVDAASDVTKIYVNGTLVGTTTTPSFDLPTTLNAFEVGRLGRSGVTDAFAGSIDELKIYDSVLTAGQIGMLAEGPGGDPSLQVSTSETFTSNGQTSVLTIPITNGGASQPLVFTEPNPVTIGGNDAGFFSVSSYDNNLAPGASGAIYINFSPSGPGPYQATLTVATNDSLKPSREVAISVEVIDPVAAVTPASINFGNFDEVTGPQTSVVTISNQGGAADLTVDALTMTGSSAFSTNESLPLVIPAGQSHNVTVTFDPGSADGRLAGSLQVSTDGYNQSIFNIPLSAVVKLANPNASLASHFTFENQANVGHDSGPLENHGTPVGDAQWTSASRVGTGALLLDGTGDLIDLGVGTGADYTSGLLSNNEGFTVACWAFVPETTTKDRVRFFSAYANGASSLAQGWGVGRRNTARNLIGTTYGKADYLAPAASAPVAGEWRHYAYVFRNVPVNQLEMYVDGVLVSAQTAATTNASGLNNATTVGFAIGALGRSDALETFEGRLDDLRIYNRELMPANIVDIFNTPTTEPSGYASWALGFGLDPDGDGDYLENPDHDGLSNALEYLLGSSPVSGVSENLPEGRIEGDFMIFVYPRKKAAIAEGFVDVVEFTETLAESEWTVAVHDQDDVTISVAPLDDDTDEVTVSIPSSGPRMFARLTVTTPVE